MASRKKEGLNGNSEKKDAKKQDLDEIPEGGLADIMKVLGPALKFYTRVRLYKLFKLIPLWIRYSFWTFVGSIVWRLKATRKIINNGVESLRLIFPNKSPEEILTISKNSWRLMGYGFFSLLLVDVPNWTEKNLAKYVEFHGLEHVDNALKRGKGAIIASTHVGLLPAMYVGMALKGYKTNLIANVRVSGPLVAIRPVPGIRCIPTGAMEGPKSIRPKLHYALKQNQLLYIFADFSQRKQMGIRFLGRLGHTPAGIPVLAQETGAAIIPAFTYPKSKNHMVIHFNPEYKLIQRPSMSKKEFLGENMLELKIGRAHV